MELPIVNDPKYGKCIFIDNSTLELLNTCPRALYYNYCREIIASGERAALNFGSALHIALEHRYKEYGNNAVDLYYEETSSHLLSEHFSSHVQPLDDYRNLNWAMELMRQYNKIYQNEPFDLFLDNKGLPMVELSFAVILCVIDGITVVYIGKIDLPTHWEDGVFILDHKSTSLLGDTFWTKMRMSAQQKGYCWSFEQLTGKTVNGYVVNALRVKAPAKKMDRDQWWRESMCRQRFLLAPGELEEWKQNTVALCEELVWHAKRDYFPMKTAWCSIYSKCQYVEVCSCEKQDRETMLNSGFFVKNTWSPLKKT